MRHTDPPDSAVDPSAPPSDPDGGREGEVDRSDGPPWSPSPRPVMAASRRYDGEALGARVEPHDPNGLAAISTAARKSD